MEALADGVYLLWGIPRYAINTYLIGNILVDASIRQMSRSLLRQIRGRQLEAHVLTHAHPDHQGASHAICEALGLPLWCGAQDSSAMERGDIGSLLPPRLTNRMLVAAFAGPAHPVARRLGAGDRVADFVVLETPGHTPGHLSLWRERDRVLFLGDVLANEHPITRQTGLREPFARFSCDPARNRQSARAIAELGPRLVCFGHGPPLRDPARLMAFVAGLPKL